MENQSLIRLEEGLRRYPLSARIRALGEIRALLKPYPERQPPMAPQKSYEPPSRGQYRKRR